MCVFIDDPYSRELYFDQKHSLLKTIIEICNHSIQKKEREREYVMLSLEDHSER